MGWLWVWVGRVSEFLGWTVGLRKGVDGVLVRVGWWRWLVGGGVL